MAPSLIARGRDDAAVGDVEVAGPGALAVGRVVADEEGADALVDGPV